MEICRGKLTFPLLCLVVGLVVFGVSYNVLGQKTGAEKSAPLSQAEANNLMFKAILDGEVELLEHALARGADANAFNTDGASALQWAILGSGKSETVYGQVKALLNRGANPNQPNIDGMTAVHTAALHGSEAVMDALISSGGDPNISTAGQTPYELAMLGGNSGAVSAIQQGTDNKPANASFLQAVEMLTQKVKKGFLTSSTDEERKQVIRKAVDELVATGFLTEAAGAALFHQLTEVQRLHEWEGGGE